MKTVKYSTELQPEIHTDCNEKLQGCTTKAEVHVCFEDGSGVSVCRSCFQTRVNEGTWCTDATEVLLAS